MSWLKSQRISTIGHLAVFVYRVVIKFSYYYYRAKHNKLDITTAAAAIKWYYKKKREEAAPYTHESAMRSGNRVPRPYKISPFEESVWPRSEKALLCVERQIFHVTGFEKNERKATVSICNQNTHKHTPSHIHKHRHRRGVRICSA